MPPLGVVFILSWLCAFNQSASSSFSLEGCIKTAHLSSLLTGNLTDISNLQSRENGEWRHVVEEKAILHHATYMDLVKIPGQANTSVHNELYCIKYK